MSASATPLTVSVVIAAFDPGPLLEEALTSIAHQRRPADEIIVVDDGTPGDAVADVVRHHAGVQLLRQENAGPAAARNRGMAASTAHTTLFLDADDRLTPGALQALTAAMGDGVDLVYGTIREFVDAERPPAEGTRSARPPRQGRIAGASLIRRALWDRVGPLDPGLPRGEWLDWMHRAEAAGARTVGIDEVVLERRIHGRNRTGAHQDTAAYVAIARAALARRRAADPGGA